MEVPVFGEKNEPNKILFNSLPLVLYQLNFLLCFVVLV